jgi:hypothetical protein
MSREEHEDREGFNSSFVLFVIFAVLRLLEGTPPRRIIPFWDGSIPKGQQCVA